MAYKQYDKKMILEKAYEMSKSLGLKKLSMRGIAEAMEASTMPIYESFTCKDELIETLFQKIVEENLTSDSYFERNRALLEYGLKHPILYRDVRQHGPSSEYFISYYHQIIELMTRETRLKDFDEASLKSLNFDLTVYINGLVEGSLVEAMTPKLEIADYLQVLDQATELFIRGYIMTIMSKPT